jgi:S1-C subfamily serine protease
MAINRLKFVGGRSLRLGLCAASIIGATAVFATAAFAADIPVDRMESSTVRILVVKDNKLAGTGSGFVVGDGSYVVTNHHVAEGADGLLIMAKGLKIEAEKIVADDPQKDLTVIKLRENTGRPPVAFSLHVNVHKTMTVLAAGFPGAADEEGSKEDLLEVKFTKGIISAYIKSKDDTLLYQIDAPINPGNSGGPLFDECGNVVGINELKSLKEAVVMGEDGQPTKERLPYGEGVAWSIQADELIPILRSAGVTPEIAGNACGAPATSTTTGSGGPSGAGPASNPDPHTFSSNRLLMWGAAGVVVLGLVVGFAVRMSSRPAVAGGVQRGGMQGGGFQQGGFQQGGFQGGGMQPYGGGGAAVQDLRLRGVSGTYAGKEFPVTAEPITLGRDPHMSQIVFDAQDSVVSKRHCIVRLDRSTGGMFVEDCGSTNGTFLETGERLRAGEPRLIRPYGSFYLGDRRHSFQVKG